MRARGGETYPHNRWECWLSYINYCFYCPDVRTKFYWDRSIFGPLVCL